MAVRGSGYNAAKVSVLERNDGITRLNEFQFVVEAHIGLAKESVA